ncbi:Profilin-1A [Zancudomyces culisetae]|uniref:Profilin n=1 Tax=Zancudomyces culisetae TaxID=1213189 RepID=A0A1R1PTG8_ZANCU|nr:Profilin-1A [Zancudomyces culisetae]|eukprot:OMH84286.1 Profilin-1A [Zancudomyces culisetae]
MSWQAYVDNNLTGTGYISQAAIYGKDGALWASSKDFKMSKEEFDTVSKAFDDPSKIRGSGLFANDVKYFALKCDDRSVYGKKESTGIICVRTKASILIGLYDENTAPGQATKVVEGLADYLISVGYVSRCFFLLFSLPPLFC